MSRSVSSRGRRSSFDQQTAEVFVTLVEFDHDDLPSPIRFTNNSEPVTSGGDVYSPLPFDISLPQDDPDTPPRAQMRIDGVTQELTSALRTIQTAPDVTISVVLASQPDTVEATWSAFKLRNIRYSASTVEGELVVESFINETYPSGRMTPSTFPGLF